MSLNLPINGVFIDIGWTMNAPATGQWMLPQRLFDFVDDSVFLSLPRERLDGALLAGMNYLNNDHLISTEEEEYRQFVEFYKIFSDILPELELSDRAVKEIAFDKVYNDDNYIFYADVRPALEKLSKRVSLGIISDTWPSAGRILRNAGIFEYFSSVTFSCSLGLYKPDGKMYEHALENMGIEPAQTLFVDDSEVNLDAARSYGIQPVIAVRNNNPNKNTTSDYTRIENLLELTDMIDELDRQAGLL